MKKLLKPSLSHPYGAKSAHFLFGRLQRRNTRISLRLNTKLILMVRWSLWTWPEILQEGMFFSFKRDSSFENRFAWIHLNYFYQIEQLKPSFFGNEKTFFGDFLFWFASSGKCQLNDELAGLKEQSSGLTWPPVGLPDWRQRLRGMRDFYRIYQLNSKPWSHQ